MTKNRAKSYCGTFPADANAYNSPEYLALLLAASEASTDRYKLVIRKRYRGPRIGKKYNRQSMCLKKDAVRFDAYCYLEYR